MNDIVKHAHNWIDRTGDSFYTRFGTMGIIVEYNTEKDITVEFQDEYKFKVKTSYTHFKEKTIKNPYDRSIYGVGYVGEGYLTKENGVAKKEYNIWKNMIRRCYSSENKYTFVAYKDCIVCDEWHNYSKFAKWYNSNYYNCSETLEVDKDILSYDHKVYSPETCMLIPRKINRFCQGSKALGTVRVESGRWRASLHHDNKIRCIGTFDNKDTSECEFLRYKNEVFHTLIKEYKGKIPESIYYKLLNARLIA